MMTLAFTWINKLIAQAQYPEVTERLFLLHQGKTLAIDILGINKKIFLVLSDHQIQLSRTGVRADASIQGTPMGLFACFFSQTAIKDSIYLSGDMALIQDVQTVIYQLVNHIDPEELLSLLMGDYLAHGLGKTWHIFKKIRRQTTYSFSRNLKESLEEDWRFIVSGAEIQDFCQDIDAISQEIERLSARIGLL